MYGRLWRWPEALLEINLKSDGQECPYGHKNKLVGGGLTGRQRKSKGCSQKTSGRSYSLKHPVARHFVCSCIVQAACHP
jgi:hypothetical protein